MQSEVDISPYSSYRGQPYWSLVRRTTTASGSETFDLGHLPSLIADANLDYSTSTITVAWSQTAPIPSAVGTLVGIYTGSWTWNFVVPPGVTSIVVPEALFSLGSSGTNYWSYNVATVSGDGLADYAAMLKAAGSMMNVTLGQNGNNDFLMAPPLPNNGDLTITGFVSIFYGG